MSSTATEKSNQNPTWPSIQAPTTFPMPWPVSTAVAPATTVSTTPPIKNAKGGSKSTVHTSPDHTA